MAITEVYVDPSINADSGTGTSGDPYGDLEYAIEQETFDLTNGTRVNIKAGTAEVLAASLDNALDDTVTTIAWAPSTNGREPNCVFEGYTTTAGDGGIGEISGGGSVAIFDSATYDSIVFRNLKVGNCGSNRIFQFDDYCLLSNCEIHTHSGQNNAVTFGSSGVIRNCYLHTLTETTGSGNIAINFSGTGCAAVNNRIEVRQPQATAEAIFMQSHCKAIRNTITVDVTQAYETISVRSSCVVMNNSIYAKQANVGVAIHQAATHVHSIITNNLIEGFSGAGGIGIEQHSGGDLMTAVLEGNAVYDCTTGYSFTEAARGEDYTDALHDNETLSASPFVDAANGDFTPVDTGNVKEGGLPDIIGLLP